MSLTEQSAAQADLASSGIAGKGEGSPPIRQDAGQSDQAEPGNTATGLIRLGKEDLRHPHGAIALAWSPDGKILASSGGSPAVRFWDPQTGQLQREFRFDEDSFARCACLEFSRDGRFLFASGSHRLNVIDVVSGEALFSRGGGRGDIYAMAVTPDGASAVLAGHEGELTFIETQPARVTRTLAPGLGSIFALEISTDGTLLAVGTDDAKLAVWDLSDAADEPRFVSSVQGDEQFIRINSLSFINNDSQIVGRILRSDGPGRSVGETQVWNARTGEVNRTIKDGATDAASLEVSADERMLALASAGGIELVDPQTGERLREMADSANAWSFPYEDNMAFSPDGKYLASVTNDLDVRIWETATGQRLFADSERHAQAMASMDISPDGKLVVTTSAEGIVNIWDSATGQRMRSILFADQLTEAVEARFTPDGQRIIAAGISRSNGGSSVRCWDVANGELKYRFDCLTAARFANRLINSRDYYAEIVFSADGSRAAVFASSRRGDAEVNVFDTATGKSFGSGFVTPPNTWWVTSAWFSDDNMVEATFRDSDQILAWDLEARQQVEEPRTIRAAYGMSLSTGSKYAVSFSAKPAADDGGVALIDTESMERLRDFSIDGRAVSPTTAAISSDGTLVAAFLWLRGLHIWNAATGETLVALGTLDLPTTVSQIRFFPDGKRLLVGFDDGTAGVLDIDKL